MPLLVVVNRLPRREADQRAVLDDARRRFEEAGLGTAGPGGHACPCSGWSRGPRRPGRRPGGGGHRAGAPGLWTTWADTAALTAVKAQAAAGRPGRPAAAVAEVAADLEADRRRAAALRAPVERAYAAEEERP